MRLAAMRDPRVRCQWLGVFAEAAAISDDERLVGRGRSSLCADDRRSRAARRARPTNRARAWSAPTLRDQIRSASAFLTAFELTGRLPYSMLAEELLQVARATPWDDDGAAIRRGTSAPTAAAVQRAVPAGRPASRPRLRGERRRRARRDLRARCGAHPRRARADCYRDHPTTPPSYGVALLDWFALTRRFRIRIYAR